MSLSVHINFDGRCEEAFCFYEKHLNGSVNSLLLYKDSPASSSIADEWQDKVLHASIAIDNIDLAGADVMLPDYQKPSGFCLLVRVPSVEKVETLFETFQVDGEVILAPQKTFWSPCYAIVNDRFGVPWKFNCVPELVK